MQSVEVHLSATYLCDTCGEPYLRPVIRRQGQEAEDHFNQYGNGHPELDRAIEVLADSGLLVPGTRPERPVQALVSFSLARADCPSGHSNGPRGMMGTFSCDRCGRDNHVSLANRTPQVVCTYCKAEFEADWSLVPL